MISNTAKYNIRDRGACVREKKECRRRESEVKHGYYNMKP